MVQLKFYGTLYNKCIVRPLPDDTQSHVRPLKSPRDRKTYYEKKS